MFRIIITASVEYESAPSGIRQKVTKAFTHSWTSSGHARVKVIQLIGSITTWVISRMDVMEQLGKSDGQRKLSSVQTNAQNNT
jgi:hypothetical protein